MSPLEQRLKNIRVILSDVDGTLTDGSLIFDKDGHELKSFFARDGSRTTLALKAGIKVFFITSRVSPAVEVRARERGISGVLSKKDIPNGSLDGFFQQIGVSRDEVLYLGDDLNDLPFLRQVGVRCAVGDATPEVKAVADIVTGLNGGRGALAEVIERVLRAQGVWDRLVGSMEILGVIPARGGSKGIPRKNIRLLNGKPLIAWTIEAAKQSKLLTRVIVSTDDQEIADIARSYGAEVPFLRPADISHDLATDVQFLNHALDFLKEREGYEPEIVLRLPPTSPLRTAAHIDEGIEVLLSHPEADASRPMTEAPKHPYKMWKVSDQDGYVEPFLPYSFTNMDEPFNMPRQILPKVFVHTGAMDVMRLRTIRELKSTSGKKLAYFMMSAEDSVNIDHITDFDLAELLMKRREQVGR